MPKLGPAETRRALDRLRALALAPVERAQFIGELLQRDPGTEVLMAVLPILAANPSADALPALHRLYEAYDNPKRDPGCYLRAAIVRAIRPLVLPGDVPLLERAVATVERTPIDPAGGAELRAVALIALTDVDPELAGFHAAALLARAGDPRHTAEMTGEPAVTAVRVLGALAQPLPLLLAAEGMERLPGEIVAACLGELRRVPDAVLAPLLERAASDRRESVQIGLADLLVRHEATPPVLRAAAALAAAPRRYDVFRYFVASVVAERHAALLAVIDRAGATEPDREKLAIVAEQLAVRRGDPAIDGPLAAVEAQLAAYAPAPPPQGAASAGDDPDGWREDR